MAQNIQAFPFDSQVQSYESDGTPIYDRATDSKGFRNLLKTYFKEGVFPNPSSNLQVVENGTLGVQVNKGSCMVGGVTILVNENVTLTLDSASTQDRIDRIVMRVDDTLSVRNAEIKVIKGTASTSPTPPARVYNDTIKDIVLANVLVSAKSSTITQSNITDTRPDSSICGWVTGTIDEVDYSVLFKQYESQFNTWFNQMKDKLSTDSAGKLQIEIDEIKEKTDYIENENIIINGYFLNPVNQRGSTTYSYDGGKTRTIDMWHLFNNSTSSALMDISKFGIRPMNGDLVQEIHSEVSEKMIQGYYTITVKLKDLDEKSFTFYDNLAPGEKFTTVLTAEDNRKLYKIEFHRYEEANPRVSISHYESYMHNDSSTLMNPPYIQWIKFERGKKFTGIYTFSYADEFNKCLRYYWKITNNVLSRVPCIAGETVKSVDIMLQLPVVMHKTPIVGISLNNMTKVVVRAGNGNTIIAEADTSKGAGATGSKFQSIITIYTQTNISGPLGASVGYVELNGGYIELDAEDIY